jgi:Flp pilus assembly protein TadB
MDRPAQAGLALENAVDQLTAYMVALAVLAAVAVFVMVYALSMPAHPNKRKATAGPAALKPSQLLSLQAKLDEARIEITAEEYIRKSLSTGVPLAIGLFVLVGAVVMLPLGVFAGFLFTWTNLEQERDVKQIKYFKQLASACDIITNAYAVRPSLVRAIQSAAEFSSSPLREDFQEMVIGLRQGEFELVLQSLSDRRMSIMFDSVMNALQRAKDESGQVKDIMEKLAISTRQNVAAFEESISMQINARSSIRWGTYGPWLIFGVFRGVTLVLSLAGPSAFDQANSFFTTLGGNILAMIAAGISIALYIHGFKLAQRGLVIRRVRSTETLPTKSAQATGNKAADPNAAKKPGRWSAKRRAAVSVSNTGE